MKTALLFLLSTVLFGQTTIQQNYDVRAYQFTLTNGSGVSGDLTSSGAGKVLTFTRGPKGIAYSASYATYLYISGGTGTAEAARITATTCTVAGGSACTVTVTTANTHSGAWTVASATGGVAEAQQAVASSPTGSGTVAISAPVTFHAPVTAPTGSGSIRFVGQGDYGPIQVVRASDYMAGDLFVNPDTGTVWYFENLEINQNTGSQTGAAIHFGNGAGGYIRNVYIVNGQYGVIFDGTGFGDVRGLNVSMLDYSYQSTAAVAIRYNGGVAHNITISDSWIGVSDGTQANQVLRGLWLNGFDGVTVSNTWIYGQYAIHVDSSSATGYNSIFICNECTVDAPRVSAVYFVGSSRACTDLQFNGSHFHGQGGAGSGTGFGIDMGSGAATSCDNVQFNGGYVEGFMQHGTYIGRTGAKNISFTGFGFRDNNRGNNAGQAGLAAINGATGLSIQDCWFGNYLTGHQKYGILAAGTLSETIITGNNLVNNETGPASFGGAFSGILSQNLGLDLKSGFGAALSVTSNTITPTHASHHVGAGLIKTITVPTGFTAGGCLQVIPDAAYTYDATGNIVVPSGGGTAVVNKLMAFCWDGSKWTPSY